MQDANRGAREGQRTLVHCNAGVSRSGTVAVEWLRRTRTLSVDAALALAREARKQITPNSAFLHQLRELAARESDGE